MDISELLKAEVREAGEERGSWTGKIGGHEITIYASALTPGDMEYVNRKHPGFESQPTQPGFVELICRKAVHEDGSKVFAPGRDKPLLMRMKSEKIASIVSGLFGNDFADETDLSDEALEDAEKN
jgi:hypothetical protein